MKHMMMVCLVCGLVPLTAMATSVKSRIYTKSESGVTIEVVTPYEKLPSCGLMPARIRISNQSGARRSWIMSSQSYGNYHGMMWSRTFSVDHQAQGEFDVFLPMATLPRGHSYPRLTINANGYGSAGHGTGISHSRHHSGSSSGKVGDLFRAVSDGCVAAIPYFTTNAIPNSPTLDFRLALEDFGSRPQAYHAIDQLWVTDDEWRQLPPVKTQAIAQWIRLGGDLVVVTSPGTPLDLASLPPGSLARSERYHYGFGRVQMIVSGNDPISEFDIKQREHAAQSRYSQLSEAHDTRLWTLRADIGKLSYPIVLVLIFTVAFAVLLGPVNLLVALRRKRPAQMLWTTPLFSLIASLVLAVVILLKDGLGGDGLRMTLAFLDPYSRTLSTMQEQVSLTGVLLGDGFLLDADTAITPLVTESRTDRRHRLYRDIDGYRSGPWFGSRSIQGQFIEQAQPTRQRVELIAAAASQAPPQLQSSIGYPLHDVYYRDPQGNLWYTPMLHTGERKTLASAEDRAFAQWWEDCQKTAGRRMRMALDRLENETGMFYAAVRETDELTIETLPAIRWQNRCVMLTGRVEPQGAP